MMRQHITKQVGWDGPYPEPGTYIHARQGGVVWLIEAVYVRRATATTPAVLTLDLLRTTAPLPKGAVVHPAARMQLTDAAGPARVRQLAGSGPTAVMKSSWRDPTDTTPNAARRPREITGYRTFCPLRRMATKSSQITDRHIMAADEFRQDVDLACHGAGGGWRGEAIATGYGPSHGPSAAALQQIEAARAVNRALARFAPSHIAMLVRIVVQHHTLHAWCQERAAVTQRPAPPDMEMGRLLTILDILADHYAPEIDAALAMEQVVGLA